MTDIKLPMQKVKATELSPSNLIIFSKPKAGKTELFAALEKGLILDLEKGTKFVDALKIQAFSVNEIIAIGQEIKKQGYPYDYIIIDTVTALETMCIDYAEVLYSKKPMGKKWFLKNAKGELDKTSGKKQYGNILNMPNGAGYAYLREAVTKVVEFIKTLAPRTILSAHIKDIQLEKAGAEFTASDIDLTGKIKRILASQSDAIGYLYRKKTNVNVLSFATTDAVACGARPKHLSNAEIVISEMVDGKLVTHWDKIYID